MGTSRGPACGQCAVVASNSSVPNEKLMDGDLRALGSASSDNEEKTRHLLGGVG